MTATASTPASDHPADDHRRWWGLAVLLSAAFLTVSDVFIVAVAAPTIRADLQVSDGVLQLVLAGYNLTYGAGLIAGGRLGDRYGRRRLFAAGLVTFTLASAISGLAPDGAVLVAGRLLQGAGAALMVPQVFATIQIDFDGHERRVAFGAFAAVSGAAAASAQLLGGLLLAADVANLGWRPIFLINLPVGVAALALTPRTVTASRQPDASRVDIVGLLLGTSAIVALFGPMVLGPELGWPLWLLPVAVAGGLLGFVFRSWQRRLVARDVVPLVPPSLFAVPGFGRACLAAVGFYASNAVLFVLLPIHLQTAVGASPLAVGMVFAAIAVPFAVVSASAGRRATDGAHHEARLGTTWLLAGYGSFAVIVLVVDGLRPGHLVPALLVAGVGMGLVNPSLNLVATRHVPPHLVGAASAVLTTALELGYAVGIVLGTSVYFTVAALVGHGASAPPVAVAAAMALPVGLSLVVRRLAGGRGADRRAPAGLTSPRR